MEATIMIHYGTTRVVQPQGRENYIVQVQATRKGKQVWLADERYDHLDQAMSRAHALAQLPNEDQRTGLAW